MFSLSALMAQGAETPHPPTPAADPDDSGLIDLKALSAGAGAAPGASPVPAHISVFMFDTPAAPLEAEVAAIEPPEPAKTWGRTLRILAAVLVSALAGAGVAVAVLRPASSPTIATETRAAASAPVTEPVAAPPAPELPKEVPVVLEPPVVSSTAMAPKKDRRPGATKKEGNRTEAPVAKKEEKKAPPSDPCNGDLRCAMERSLLR